MGERSPGERLFNICTRLGDHRLAQLGLSIQNIDKSGNIVYMAMCVLIGGLKYDLGGHMRHTGMRGLCSGQQQRDGH